MKTKSLFLILLMSLFVMSSFAQTELKVDHSKKSTIDSVDMSTDFNIDISVKGMSSALVQVAWVNAASTIDGAFKMMFSGDNGASWCYFNMDSIAVSTATGVESFKFELDNEDQIRIQYIDHSIAGGKAGVSVNLKRE